MEPGKGNCSTCAGLIRLCIGLDFFPTDAGVRRLLIERLHRLARSHEHARAMVDRWLDTETAAPKVADLVGLAAAVKLAGQGELPAGCARCEKSTGAFVIVERNGYEYAERCTCPRGQTLRQMDQRREQNLRLAS